MTPHPTSEHLAGGDEGMSGSVVGRLTAELAEVEKRAPIFRVGRIQGDDLRLLLAAVEAAKDLVEIEDAVKPYKPTKAADVQVAEARSTLVGYLHVLYADPDSQQAEGE